jgi:retinol dehydrogenase-12
MELTLSRGLGFEVAKHFSKLNPSRLIIACRSLSKGEEAARQIKASGGVEPEVWHLNLASLNQTRAFGEKCLKELDRLDICVSPQKLMNNRS